MSLDLIIMSLGGGSVIMPPTLFVSRGDGGAPVEFVLDADGFRYHRTSSTLTQISPWASPTSTASLYEARTTVTSNAFTADPSAGNWISLGTTRLWSRTAAVSATQSVTATLEIRNASTLVVVSTTILTLECAR